MIAVQKGNVDVVNALLGRKDLDIEATNAFHGDTALSYAARFGNEAVVKALLDHGASKTHTAYNGLTAEQQAVTHHRKELAELLRTYETQPLPAVQHAENHKTSWGRFWHRGGNVAAVCNDPPRNTIRP